ncbi:potassium channel subfamily K member 4 isoform X2 [Nematostella vectensis]|nr:potassium channel subfamily K member 4 isoform X2 [Nematostella vectensis]XP_048587976.1 potassium channel subfamily K member 4 isoform X2 [Nematostella vectensis]
MKLQQRTRTLLVRLFLLTAYSLSGAAVFHLIEYKPDKEHFCGTEDTRVETAMANQFNASMEVIRAFVQEMCEIFERTHKCKYSHNDWSYYQSLYFVGSVTTTIGYGHLAPKTQSGRLFLIFFAMVGIPLNLVTLQSVGEHINLVMHILIRQVERNMLKRSSVRHEHVKIFLLSIALIVLILPLGGLMYYRSEHENGWTYLDSVYYCFVAISTIGFGDLVPNEGREPDSTYERVMWFIRLLYLGLGLSLVSSVFTSVSSATKQLKVAFSCKQGSYQVSRNSPNKPPLSINYKKTPFLEFRELLCTRPLEANGVRTTGIPNDAYSRIEDRFSISSASGTHSHSATYSEPDEASCRRYSRGDIDNGHTRYERRQRSVCEVLPNGFPSTGRYRSATECSVLSADETSFKRYKSITDDFNDTTNNTQEETRPRCETADSNHRHASKQQSKQCRPRDDSSHSEIPNINRPSASINTPITPQTDGTPTINPPGGDLKAPSINRPRDDKQTSNEVTLATQQSADVASKINHRSNCEVTNSNRSSGGVKATTINRSKDNENLSTDVTAAALADRSCSRTLLEESSPGNESQNATRHPQPGGSTDVATRSLETKEGNGREEKSESKKKRDSTGGQWMGRNW